MKSVSTTILLLVSTVVAQGLTPTRVPDSRPIPVSSGTYAITCAEPGLSNGYGLAFGEASVMGNLLAGLGGYLLGDQVTKFFPKSSGGLLSFVATVAMTAATTFSWNAFKQRMILSPQHHHSWVVSHHPSVTDTNTSFYLSHYFNGQPLKFVRAVRNLKSGKVDLLRLKADGPTPVVAYETGIKNGVYFQLITTEGPQWLHKAEKNKIILSRDQRTAFRMQKAQLTQATFTS